jgi:imidazole glycerol phosphate synthase, glutamine amidotransferase subunit
MLISLADYGVGNLHSIKKALENSGATVRVVKDMKELLNAECIVFPGVGAFDRPMEKIAPYKDEICSMLRTGTPALGICIGMHILFEGSEEGVSEGIGFMNGPVKKLRCERIPHMGWNSVDSDDPIMDGVESKAFYFAHSYHAEPSESVAVGTTSYENIMIDSLFRKGNTYGCQFHPEKSSSSGMTFLKNFIEHAEDPL